MAKNPDNLARSVDAEDTGGLLGGFLAEEEEFDRGALWRLGSWGVGAVGAVIIAVMANQSSLSWRRDRVAAADLTRQAQQIQAVARESQNETRRLASAIDTLNNDRDRLYSRVTTLEQGLDSVTGAIARQSTAATSPPSAQVAATPPDPPAAQAPTPAPAIAPVTTSQANTPAADKPAATEKPATVVGAETNPRSAPSASRDTAKIAAAMPSTPLVVSKSTTAPDPTAGKLVEPNKPASVVTASPIPEVVAAAPPVGDAEADRPSTPGAAIQRTEFGVDLGSANSVAGLRALWRGLLKSRSNAPLFNLRPILVVKEGPNGLGMQLRLVAGPLNDAGAAAKICAVLTENQRRCETAIFDGQRLSINPEDPPPPTAAKPAPRGSPPKRAAIVEEPNKPEPTTVTSLFGRKSSQ
ncbi:MAG: hypothetical protein ACJ8FZ_24835 [Bradyrhizobium sp.]